MPRELPLQLKLRNEGVSFALSITQEGLCVVLQRLCEVGEFPVKLEALSKAITNFHIHISRPPKSSHTLTFLPLSFFPLACRATFTPSKPVQGFPQVRQLLESDVLVVYGSSQPRLVRFELLKFCCEEGGFDTCVAFVEEE